MKIRAMTKTDFDALRAVVDAWWGGRAMQALLHPVYLYQFGNMAFVAERDGILAGFVVGFVSQTRRDEAYIHLVGTSPDFRKQGVARILYEHFFSQAQAENCRQVKAITSSANQVSIDFHQHMGFQLSLEKNYSGPGQDRVVFVRTLS